jgi:hypothetical protein
LGACCPDPGGGGAPLGTCCLDPGGTGWWPLGACCPGPEGPEGPGGEIIPLVSWCPTTRGTADELGSPVLGAAPVPCFRVDCGSGRRGGAAGTVREGDSCVSLGRSLSRRREEHLRLVAGGEGEGEVAEGISLLLPLLSEEGCPRLVLGRPRLTAGPGLLPEGGLPPRLGLLSPRPLAGPAAGGGACPLGRAWPGTTPSIQARTDAMVGEEALS